MRCEIIAIGTELLLGQTIDSNSAWLGQQLALAGIHCHYQTRVGDNLGRMIEALKLALARNEAVIVCGGLGPTQDDITREAISAVMGVTRQQDETLVELIRERFHQRGRPMAENNLRQAEVPVGASPIPEMPGTAPGLICPLGEQVIYAVPGVPREMRAMVSATVLPDLRRRAGKATVIRSRVLRTWGESESGIAERLAERIRALDISGNPTLAFQASGIEGIKVRITARADDDASAQALLDAEEQHCRALIDRWIFAVDEQTMEAVILQLLQQRHWQLAVAESLTGGLLSARLTAVPGASQVFRGGLVAYQSAVKFQHLGVPKGPVVSAAAAEAMAQGVRERLDTQVGIALTGVAGPDGQEDQPVGTVFLGLALPSGVESCRIQLPGDREQIRQYAVISVLNLLRLRLLGRDEPIS